MQSLTNDLHKEVINMNVEEIQEKIDRLHYWDARVLMLACDYFADEVRLTYEDSNGNVNYIFNMCYNVEFKHNLKYCKMLPSRNLMRSQIPYFLQDVNVSCYEEEGIMLYKCTINMEPINLEILCKDIQIEKDEIRKENC